MYLVCRSRHNPFDWSDPNGEELEDEWKLDSWLLKHGLDHLKGILTELGVVSFDDLAFLPFENDDLTEIDQVSRHQL